METSVFSIASILLTISTSTSSPISNPSEFFGMTTIPSALTRVMVTPAPRFNGVAISLLPTLPRVTLTYSLCFREDTSLLEIIAFTLCRSTGFARCNARYRPDYLFKNQVSRSGISRDTNDRLAIHNSQNGRFTGFYSDAMQHQFSQITY